MTSRPFDIVVFDLGGVLVRIAHSWAEAHALAGLPPHPIVDDPEFELARIDLGARHQDGSLSSAEYFRLKADASRGVYTAGDIERILEVWSGEEYDGVSAVIDALEAAEVTTGALSNTNPAHWARLDGTPEYPTVARLQHRHASHLLRLAKPDPAIFRAFARRTGIEAGRTLFFDDALANVEAARKAGWTADLVDPFSPTAEQILAHLSARGVIAHDGLRRAVPH